MLRAPPSRDRDPREPPGAAAAGAPARSVSGIVAAPPRRRLPRAWLLGAAGTVVLLLVIGLAAFGPIVRSKIAKEGARRRLDVTVGSVRPGFFAVGLKDVHVRLQNVPGIEVRLDEVRVDLTAGLSVREVAGHGGEIRIDGEPETIVERLRAFQKEGKTAAPAAEKARKTALSVDGLALVWKVEGGEIVGSAIKAARDDDAIHLGCGRVAATYRRSTLEVLGGDVELGPDGTARRITATSVTVGQEPQVKAPASAPASAAAVDPPPPSLPPPVPPGSKRGSKAVAVKAGAKTSAAVAAVAAPDEPVLPLPDLHGVRARIATLAQTFGTRVPDGSKVDIGGLSVKLDVGGEPFAFGPGPFTMERHADVIRLTFASEKSGAQTTPLSIDAELPLNAGDVTAKLSGGPVSLALLGVKEGTKGLLDVAKGTVSGRGLLVLSAPGDALTFDGQIALHAISVKQPRLAAEPLRGIDLAISARGLLNDAGLLRVDDAQLDMGALHVRTHGTLEETTDHFGLALSVEIAPAACQALLDSTPQGLLPTVRTARMAGSFGATSRVVFDTRSIDKLVLDYQIDDKCRMIEVPRELSRDRFTSSFTYRTYHPDGTPSDTTSGPSTTSWTDLDGISPFMVAAVLTTEDGAFYKHHGFNHNAIKNSVAANLKARRFVRGASTITMQLAKNLFLSREKTLSRKIEEVILTDYLEQAFRKDDMMELYLNVIEFGPDVYGVTRAAEHYFGRKPEELNLPECFFLA
ncbi:MAG TPA: biosynthetic peptidoglycan transglycosylase, partial [Labilithrix sp.]|nr:biosynthetic peptidoglycan transglycosylase [Labilithrix sp.]